VALIAGRAVGATMPNLNTSILREVTVAVPPTKLQEKFVCVADANDELIDVLVEQSAVLRRQRDLLLPRLLSGEIDVSTLPLPPPTGL
jgi:type I restriction enzyme S subunit